MSDQIDGLSGIGAAQGGALSAHELAAQTLEESIRAENLSSLAESTLSQAVTRPNAETPLDQASGELTGPASGSFGELKEGFVSPVERSGTSQAAEVDSSENLQVQSEERIQALYYDLTNYQIAWKIAQRMQQDITQLLRG